MKDDGFRAYVLDQLAAVDRVHARAMFGGVGLYADDVFFGLIADGALYFKVDDSNRADYQSAGMIAFKPFQDKPSSSSYFQVPLEVLEDADTLAEWARASIRAAKATGRPKRVRP